MCMRLIFLGLLTILLSSLKAQVLNDSLQSNINNNTFSLKSKHKIINPVTIAAGYAGLCLITYRYVDDEVQEFTQANQNKTVYNTFKTVGYAGLGTSSIIITAGTGLTALITKDKRFEKTAILLAGGHLINDLVTNQLKITFQRHRPNTGDGYNKFDWRDGSKANLSFISSHTSNAFTTATAFAICFSDKKWVPIVAYSTASIVGLSRIYQNQHWTSDVLVGAAVGFLSTHAMNKIYSVAGKKFTFLPSFNDGHFGADAVFALR